MRNQPVGTTVLSPVKPRNFRNNRNLHPRIPATLPRLCQVVTSGDNNVPNEDRGCEPCTLISLVVKCGFCPSEMLGTLKKARWKKSGEHSSWSIAVAHLHLTCHPPTARPTHRSLHVKQPFRQRFRTGLEVSTRRVGELCPGQCALSQVDSQKLFLGLHSCNLKSGLGNLVRRVILKDPTRGFIHVPT